jgi:hypothetical protein
VLLRYEVPQLCLSIRVTLEQGLNCQKISGGLTSAYSLSLSLHTGNSASLTTAEVETDPPPGYPRASCLGRLSKQLGVQPPQPPPRQFKHCTGNVTLAHILISVSEVTFIFKILHKCECTVTGHEYGNTVYILCRLLCLL